MRMGVIQAIGYLVNLGFQAAVQRQPQLEVPGEDQRDNEANEQTNQAGAAHTRDSLLDVLLERFRDTWHYARSRVLQTWSYLAEYVQWKCIHSFNDDDLRANGALSSNADTKLFPRNTFNKFARKLLEDWKTKQQECERMQFNC